MNCYEVQNVILLESKDSNKTGFMKLDGDRKRFIGIQTGNFMEFATETAEPCEQSYEQWTVEFFGGTKVALKSFDGGHLGVDLMNNT